MKKKYCIFLVYSIIYNTKLISSLPARYKNIADWIFYGDDPENNTSTLSFDRLQIEEDTSAYTMYEVQEPSNRPYEEPYVERSYPTYPPSPPTSYEPSYTVPDIPSYAPPHVPSFSIPPMTIHGHQIHFQGYGIPFQISSIPLQMPMPFPMPYQPHSSMSSYTPYEQFDDPADCICGVPRHRRYRILNGHPASHAEYPWMAELHKYHGLTAEDEKGWGCTAAMITLLHLLAAAHCFFPNYRRGYATLADGQDHDIETFYVPSGYIDDDVPLRDDIAVAPLKQRVPYGTIVPLCLPLETEDFSDRIGTAAGWGWLSETGPNPDQLMQVKLPIFTAEETSRTNYEYSMPSSMFCAGAMNGSVDTCPGDSGGPLMVKGPNHEMIVAGVLSGGRGAGKEKYPSIYTKVSSHLDWIMSELGSETICRRP